MRKIVFVFAMALLAIVLLPQPALAEPAAEPVVHGVLFHSPSCPHCREYIENDYPLYKEEFGDQFQLLMIDTSTTDGGECFTEANDTLDFRRAVVPTMILGDVVMHGKDEINAQAPDIIREHLATGDGLALPPLTCLESYEGVESESFLSSDNIANIAAVFILIGLVGSFGFTATMAYQSRQDDNRLYEWATGPNGRILTWGVAVVALIISITLVFHETDDTLARVMSLASTLALIVIVIAMGNPIYRYIENRSKVQQKGRKHSRRLKKATIRFPNWVLPVIVLAGLAVAIYLSYVETQGEEAACGFMGDCNAVQQSEYAELFGLIPIGVLGVVGYALILVLWLGTQVSNSQVVQWSHIGLLGASLFGVVFSSYLTFLEPFVIEATCTWCLTSAVVMLLLLWLTLPEGWKALENYLDGSQSSADSQLTKARAQKN